MKKLIIALLFTNLVSAQYVAFIGGLDLKNATIGSDATNNKPELNYSLQFTMVSIKNVEAGIGYESFERIDFNRMYLSAGVQFPIGQFKIIPTLEPSIINRFRNWGGGLDYNFSQSFLTVAFNLAIQYGLNDRFAVQSAINLLPRPDDKMMFDDSKITPSITAKLVYKINL